MTQPTSAQYRLGPITIRRAVVGGFAALIGYAATIVAANLAIHHLGTPPPPHVPAPHTLPVWPGLAAPSGVYFVALALVLRNVVQRQFGRNHRLVGYAAGAVAVLVGAAVSWVTTSDANLAKASLYAFLLSEFLDMTIYSVLREKYGQVRAVLPAALAGGALDSWVFLHFAFHSEGFFWAQFAGKSWGVLGAVIIIAAVPAITARLPRTAEAVPA